MDPTKTNENVNENTTENAPATPPAPTLDDALKEIALLKTRLQQQDAVVAAAAQKLAATPPAPPLVESEEDVDPEIDKVVQKRLAKVMGQLEPKLAATRDMSDFNQYMQRWGGVFTDEQHKQIEGVYRNWMNNGVREINGFAVSREDAVSFIFGEANKAKLLEQSRGGGLDESRRRAGNAQAFAERGGTPIAEPLGANPDFDKLPREERIKALEKRLDAEGF